MMGPAGPVSGLVAELSDPYWNHCPDRLFSLDSDYPLSVRIDVKSMSLLPGDLC